MNVFLKILVSAVLIGVISEMARRHSSMAALLASVPLVSVLAMIWIYHETRDIDRIAAFSTSVFWYVLPSLLLFVLLPVFLKACRMPFYAALGLAVAATVAGFFVLKFVLGRLGIQI